MKVMHVPYTFHPDPVGGTEIYVEALANSLAGLDVESVICAPGPRGESYVRERLRVIRFAGLAPPLPLDYCYDEGDGIAAEAFGAVLERERPDVVHLHALSPMVSLKLVRVVKARGLPLVFTYHTPAATCQRGTLLRWGRSVCEGALAVRKCTSCSLQGLGVPRAMASLLGAVPQAAGRFVASRGLSGGTWTALRMSDLVGRKHSAVRAFLQQPDAIVAPSEWVRELLIANGVHKLRIVLCRQGVETHANCLPVELPARSGGPLRVIVLTRLEPAKGLDVLVAGLAQHRDLDVRVDVYGEGETPGGDEYSRGLSRRISTDDRIRLMRAIPHEEVLATIARYDVLAAPSQGYETGPLVVLEAFAAGVPVVGSDLGGIAERVVHEKNGLLVPHSREEAWAAAFARLVGDPRLLSRLRLNITPPAGMDGVSAVMRSLYSDVAAR